MARRDRDSGVELLRVLAACGVVALHFNNALYADGLGLSTGVNHVALTLLQGIFACAVDLFVMVSGYFMVTSPRRDLWKVVGLLAQASLCRVAVYALGTCSGGQALTVRGIAGALLPVNYYVALYSATYLLSPWVNLAFAGRTRQELDLMAVTLLLVLSAWPTAVDILGKLSGSDFGGMSSISMEGSLSGYTLTNFLLAYCLGGLLRLREDSLRRRLRSPGLLFVACACLSAALRLVSEWMGDPEILAPMSYCSPVVLCSAASALLWARGAHVGCRPWLNRLAGGAFWTFLVNIPIVCRMPAAWVVGLPLPAMLLALAGMVAGTYVVGFVLSLAWDATGAKALSWMARRVGRGAYEVRGAAGSLAD